MAKGVVRRSGSGGPAQAQGSEPPKRVAPAGGSRWLAMQAGLVDTRSIMRRAWRAGAAVLLPFLLAFVGTLAIRAHAVYQAAEDIAIVAERVSAELAKPEDTRDIVDRLARDVKDLDDGRSTSSRAVHEQLVRTLAYRLQSQELPSRQRYQSEVFFGLLEMLFVDRLVEGTIVLFFPTLVLLAILRAARTARMLSPTSSDLPERIDHERHCRFLVEEARFFRPAPLGFAANVSLGSLYLFAPLGLKASAIREFIVAYAPPGAPTFPSWFDFAHSAPFVSGFAGFLVYSGGVFLRRFSQEDLNHRMFVPLFNRGIGVAILSLVMTGITEGDTVSRALCFAVGVFPEAGIQAVSKVASTTVERMAFDSSSGFRDLPQIDFWKEMSLREVGIYGIHDLAESDWREMLATVGINPRVLLDAADRALLMHVFGVERAGRLSAVSVFSASALVRLVDRHGPGGRKEAEAKIEAALGVTDVGAVIDELYENPNLLFQARYEGGPSEPSHRTLAEKEPLVA